MITSSTRHSNLVCRNLPGTFALKTVKFILNGLDLIFSKLWCFLFVSSFLSRPKSLRSWKTGRAEIAVVIFLYDLCISSTPLRTTVNLFSACILLPARWFLQLSYFLVNQLFCVANLLKILSEAYISVSCNAKEWYNDIFGSDQGC